MPKLTGFNGEDRYNFLLALVGFLVHRGEVELGEVAEHFGLEEPYIRRALRSINETTAYQGDFQQWPFFIDVDLLDEGIVSLTTAEVIDDVPRLSTRQAAAISAGLGYLATIPEFAGNPEIRALQEKISSGSGASAASPVISIAASPVEMGAETLREAILAGKAISCEYINRKGEKTVREIDPLRIDVQAGVWYLRGYCPINEGVRNFLIEHMRSIEVLDKGISEAAKNVAEIEDATYVAEQTDTTVTVEVMPEAYRLISESQTVNEPKNAGDGLIRAEINVGHLPNIGRLIAKYGGAARVIAPAEAREIVKNYALAALGKTATRISPEVE